MSKFKAGPAFRRGGVWLIGVVAAWLAVFASPLAAWAQDDPCALADPGIMQQVYAEARAEAQTPDGYTRDDALDILVENNLQELSNKCFSTPSDSGWPNGLPLPGSLPIWRDDPTVRQARALQEAAQGYLLHLRHGIGGYGELISVRVETGIDSAIAALEAGTDGPDTSALTKDYWDDIGNLYKQNLSVLCPDETAIPEGCKNAYRTAVNTRRISTAMGVVVRRIDAGTLHQMLAEISLLNDGWTYYFTEARPQFLWELVINDWFVGDPKGGKGFIEPPRHQIIFLHPGVGLEYADVAADGSDMEASAVMEWLGINRWWGSGKSALGLSLITTYTDRVGAADVRNGVMVHVNHGFSLGVTRRDGDYGVFLNYNLAEQAQKGLTRWKESKLRAYLQGEQPPPADSGHE